ncbi:hypothetical protein AMTRI_Chr13g115970 [Amborella trichopoda]
MEKILLLLPVKSIICFQSVVSYPLLRLLESTLSPAHLHYPIPLLSFSLWMTVFLSMDDCVMYVHDTDNELSCRKTKIRAPWVLPSLHSSLGSRTVVSNGILCIFNSENNGGISVIDVFYLLTLQLVNSLLSPTFLINSRRISRLMPFLGFILKVVISR